jgi:microsomal dipeptidase-like Zn-dependent dipeptidase
VATAATVVDLHAHYPMHLRPGREEPLIDRLDAGVIATASRLWNYESRSSGPRVTVEGMRRGDVGVALSVLCTPWLEFGTRFTRIYRRRSPYGRPPVDAYFPVLLRQLERVERHVAERHGDRVSIARTPAEIDAALAGGRLALVHCVEGGFSLGATPESVADAVRTLAARGVAYITLAHLVWRHVATNAPCAPFMSEQRYHWLFPQPPVGLTELGRTAIRTMVAEGVLVDLTHMSARSLEDAFDLLDELDPRRSVPVLASHAAYRFGRLSYNLDDGTVERVAERGGVIGLIASRYFMADGQDGAPLRTWPEAFEVVCHHIERIRALTGSFDCVAIGTDLDGFIKPTLPGLEDSGRLGRLVPALAERYGPEVAHAIASGNAMRVLRAGWRGAPGAGRLASSAVSLALP